MSDEEEAWFAGFAADLREHVAERETERGGPAGPVPPEVVEALLAANGLPAELVELDDDGVETTGGMLVTSRYLLTGEGEPND